MQKRQGGWENELLIASLLPTSSVAVYSLPLVGGAFLWGGKAFPQLRRDSGFWPHCASGRDDSVTIQEVTYH